MGVRLPYLFSYMCVTHYTRNNDSGTTDLSH